MDWDGGNITLHRRLSPSGRAQEPAWTVSYLCAAASGMCTSELNLVLISNDIFTRLISEVWLLLKVRE